MQFDQKLIWLTDLHVTVSGEAYGARPNARLKQVIAEINRLHSDAACCVISGDLTDLGTPEEYETLAGLLDNLSIPVLPLIGNHDNRENFLARFALPGEALRGFVQYRKNFGAVTLLCLDTCVTDAHHGEFDQKRLDWLSDALEAAQEQRVLVFMHHPLGALGLGPLDEIPLVDYKPLIEVLRNAPQVEHLFCGHVHRPVTGNIGGMPFTTARSLCFQARAPFEAWDWDDCVAVNERPQYSVILTAPDRLVVQAVDLEDLA